VFTAVNITPHFAGTSAMIIGPQESSPAAAFDVRAQRWPPGDLMSAKRSRMATGRD